MKYYEEGRLKHIVAWTHVIFEISIVLLDCWFVAFVYLIGFVMHQFSGFHANLVFMNSNVTSIQISLHSRLGENALFHSRGGCNTERCFSVVFIVLSIDNMSVTSFTGATWGHRDSSWEWFIFLSSVQLFKALIVHENKGYYNCHPNCQL